ncbi:type II toxin-antitoxin system RelE/ParE family toxin [Geobacillus zalihae]|uniref:type II toxin-antitoxin system RelE family toxin n=1 Tax=Geobacillus TaxID=129337 RepID=UPI000763DAAB|nr:MULTISPECIES: type II toxin-antitoxin system RelE/ParE family toxin [Geobacillus]OQP17234.1 plasmid stabilization protein [Geobacillus zalihae]QNU26245.1 type II toxin-antitoxin system RelE/ParE family toxin [Geobacillus zalihae]RXS85112.1 type II toxin-antitoxin system RelE/ParE family toxin [Geobacillus sp. PK12]WKA47091.1 type II toxin-antitoxin system RelE/ParE family toxin [Geobacillus zalihae]
MNSGYKLIYRKAAVKFIARQDKDVQERFAFGLQGLLAIPPQGDIKKLKGQDGLYRLRVGTYRVLFRIDHDERIIYIEAIGNRGDVY